jgi:hypothetical protein
MKKRILGTIAAAMLIVGTGAFAQVTVVAPQIDITDPAFALALGGDAAAVEAQINTALATAANQVQSQSDISKYDGKQEELAKGFGNANAYSAQAATLQGYQGYSLFAVSGGFMFGSQLPSLDPNKLTAISDTIADDPDVYAGLAPSVTFINVGFNAQKVFGFFNKDLGDRLKHFYFNVKFGSLSQSFGTGDNTLDFDTTNFGIGVNYQWLPSVGILGGFARWRGINFGSGFLYQSNTIDFTTTTSVTQSVTTTDSSTSTDVTTVISANPKLNVEAKMNTVSIPLEATTSVQFLWLFNLNAGVGADLVFGSSNITATGTSNANVDSMTVNNGALTKTYTNGNGYNITQQGKVSVKAGTDGNPELARVRLMTGLGFNVGPLKLDIPVYYYLASGLALGITGGFVW